MCAAVEEDAAPAEILWREAERQRLRQRGYPEPLAEFWVLCAGAGHTEKDLLALGMATAAVRRLRYLELPSWAEVVGVVQTLCPKEEVLALERLWRRARTASPSRCPTSSAHACTNCANNMASPPRVGRPVRHWRQKAGPHYQVHRRGRLLFGSGVPRRSRRAADARRRRGRRLARRLARAAYAIPSPASSGDPHRLAAGRELYGFEARDMEPILGYSSLEYQKLERGVQPLADTALRAHLAGDPQGRPAPGGNTVAAPDPARSGTRRLAVPNVGAGLIALLARREGGLIPLSRYLKKAGLKGLWTARLRAIGHGEETPPWCVLKQIAQVCGVAELADVHHDWRQRYRERLAACYPSPLAVELRLLIGEVAESLRDFSPRLEFNYSVLVRDLQKIDRDDFVKWFHVERIARAAGLPPHDERWREMHALWRTASDRKKHAPPSRRWAASAARRD